jgi:hypothetical protein
MILKVIGTNGDVLHDCKEAGCSVSWDGYALRDLSPKDLHDDDATRPSDLLPVKIGERVPGASDPDETVFEVKGRVAKQKRDS